MASVSSLIATTSISGAISTILTLAVFGGAALFVGVVLWLFYRRRYRRIGPEEALIVYGRKARKERDGFRVIVGGGTFVRPFIEEATRLPLNAMQLTVNLNNVLAGSARTPINVSGTATVKIPATPKEREENFPTVRLAAGNFLGMSVNEIRDALTKVVSGHLRTIVAGLSVEDLYEDQAKFQEELKHKAEEELRSLGYEFLSFVFDSITDENGYLDSLGVPEIERARRDARIAKAENDRDASVREEDARLETEQRQLSVQEEVAVSGRNLSIREAGIKEEVDVANARARAAGERADKEESIEIARQETERQRLELDATIRERADADKFAEERRAESERFRIEQEAEAELARRRAAAEAVEVEARAEATRLREVGEAEASAIAARGKAEADSRMALAEALQQYNDAGLSLEALKILPDVVSAAAEPLSRAGSTTIISNGSDSPGSGVTKLTGDVTQALAETLPIVEKLTGLDITNLLKGATQGAKTASVDADEVAPARGSAFDAESGK